MQSLLILLAPLLFAATIYMGLGRIVKAIDGDKQCLIRPVYLTKIFVAGDIFSFFVQGCGRCSAFYMDVADVKRSDTIWVIR